MTLDSDIPRSLPLRQTGYLPGKYWKQRHITLFEVRGLTEQQEHELELYVQQLWQASLEDLTQIHMRFIPLTPADTGQHVPTKLPVAYLGLAPGEFRQLLDNLRSNVLRHMTTILDRGGRIEFLRLPHLHVTAW